MLRSIDRSKTSSREVRTPPLSPSHCHFPEAKSFSLASFYSQSSQLCPKYRHTHLHMSLGHYYVRCCFFAYIQYRRVFWRWLGISSKFLFPIFWDNAATFKAIFHPWLPCLFRMRVPLHCLSNGYDHFIKLLARKFYLVSYGSAGVTKKLGPDFLLLSYQPFH